MCLWAHSAAIGVFSVLAWILAVLSHFGVALIAAWCRAGVAAVAGVPHLRRPGELHEMDDAHYGNSQNTGGVSCGYACGYGFGCEYGWQRS